MELTIQLEDNADISFIKKLLSQIKGIKSVDVSEEDKTYSWDEIENSEFETSEPKTSEDKSSAEYILKS